MANVRCGRCDERAAVRHNRSCWSVAWNSFAFFSFFFRDHQGSQAQRCDLPSVGGALLRVRGRVVRRSGRRRHHPVDSRQGRQHRRLELGNQRNGDERIHWRGEKKRHNGQRMRTQFGVREADDRIARPGSISGAHSSCFLLFSVASPMSRSSKRFSI